MLKTCITTLFGCVSRETLGKILLFIKCNRHVPGKNCAIRAAVMSFHYRLMLFVSDGPIFLSVMVFLQNSSLFAVSGIAELFHVKQFSRKAKRTMTGASHTLGFRNAEFCFICGLAIGLFMLNWLFYCRKDLFFNLCFT